MALVCGSQIFVKDLEGGTHCLKFEAPSLSGAELKERLESCLGLPISNQRLVTGTREVVDETLLIGSDDGHGASVALLPSCTLLLRLVGGKGGFGSLLRGAATKAGQKKTTNFDACRDMSGRRLRHVNAEKKLKEWQRDGKQRELEKAALHFLRKTERERTVEAGRSTDISKVREESAEARENVVDAVVSGLQVTREARDARKKKRKRELENETKSQKPSKIKSRMLEMLETVDESDEDGGDESEHEAEAKEIVPAKQMSDCEPVSSPDSEGEGVSSPRGPIPIAPFASSPSDSSESSREGKESEEGGCPSNSSLDRTTSGNGAVDVCTSSLATSAVTEERSREGGVEGSSVRGVDSVECSLQKSRARNTLASNANEDERGLESTGCVLHSQNHHEDNNTEHKSDLGACGSLVSGNRSEPDKATGANTPENDDALILIGGANLCLETYSTAKDLEVLGMEGLKSELQNRGLKCGGSLEQRAGRLFLLKTTPLHMLDKKHFAKPVPRKGP